MREEIKKLRSYWISAKDIKKFDYMATDVDYYWSFTEEYKANKVLDIIQDISKNERNLLEKDSKINDLQNVIKKFQSLCSHAYKEFHDDRDMSGNIGIWTSCPWDKDYICDICSHRKKESWTNRLVIKSDQPCWPWINFPKTKLEILDT